MSRLAKTTARGYGNEHQKLRAQWKPRVDALSVTCWRCGRLIIPIPGVRGQGWDLGHDDDDRGLYRGPEHVHCNRRASAIRSNRRRTRRKRRWGL